jgi:hypothetical protein
VVTSYSTSPALPTGLTLDPATGGISGTPTATTATATYTITAANGSGMSTFALSITVNEALPAVANVIVSYGPRQVILNWGAVTGAADYQVMKNPDGVAGFAPIGPTLTTTTYADQVSVHLTDWINARYIVRACNSSGCTDSAAVQALDSKLAVAYFKASNPESNDHFGLALALSGDGNTLAVGAPAEASAATGVNGDQSDNTAVSSGAVYLFTRSGSVWIQQAYLKASNTDAQDNFGTAVALSADGSTLAVGAPYEDSAATGVNGDQTNNSRTDSGAVYLFARLGLTWSQQAYLKDSNAQRRNGFGSALALSADGNTLAIGALYENNSAGATYVFARSGAIWSQQGHLTASNPDIGDEFGNAVALSADGNTLAVGASYEGSAAVGINGIEADNSALGAGAAYVFTRSGVTWTQLAYVKASNTEAADAFGSAVALSGDGKTLAVGAPGEDSAATGLDGNQLDNSAGGAGAAYVYTRSGSNWAQTYVKSSNTDSADAFGIALAMNANGTMLAVGSSQEASAATGINGDQTDNSASLAGAAYIFVHSGTAWKSTYVKASNTRMVGSFGLALALSADGSTFAAADYRESGGSTGFNGDQFNQGAGESGAVYVY